MKKLSLLTLVNQYIDDEKKRNKTMRSMSAIYQWIEGDVDDELTAINDEYNLIVEKNDKQARIIFEDSIKAQFKTNYFQDFLLNKSKTTEPHYKKLKNKCSISNDAIKGFFKPESGSNPKTLDFFTAFCKNQQREYGEKLQTPEKIALPPPNPDERQTKTQQIVGATIIDEAFIQKVKTGKTFTMPEFYTAKQNEDCQWYGIIQKWDIERKDFNDVRNKIKEIFNIKRTYKISSVISGNGGVGKSTFLRRLAFELHSQLTFKVVWVNDNQIDDFVKQGIKIIENEKQINFLVIVEDWYRMFDGRNNYFVKEFLECTNRIENVRFVIGDRNVRGKEYMKYLNNDVSPRLLTSDENKYIIRKILANYPEWTAVSEKLFENQSSYESSLFLLLFVIARISKEEGNNNLIDLSEPQTAFVNIIESDIKFIANKYKGLATILYYWSCVYSQYKIFISYYTFLNLADFYNENEEISRFFIHWEANDEYLERMKIYIHKGFLEDHRKIDYVHFNHDTLADSGLSKINFTFQENFGDKIKLDLLEFIINKGDDPSASMFLSSLLEGDEKLFLNREDKLKYINILLDKNNTHRRYLMHLSSLLINKEERNKYKKILNEKGINDTTAKLIMF